MNLRFAPHDNMPMLLGTAWDEPLPYEWRCPSGWWILPGIIGGCVEWIAIVGWIAS